MVKANYTLNIKYVDGSKEEISLTSPHQLVPDNKAPHVLVYSDKDGCMHNVPFSSIVDFWFMPEDYNDCEKEAKSGCKDCSC